MSGLEELAAQFNLGYLMKLGFNFPPFFYQWTFLFCFAIAVMGGMWDCQELQNLGLSRTDKMQQRSIATFDELQKFRMY